MPAPHRPPLGLQVSRTAKALGRAFDEALAAAGGSTPTWLVLLALRTGSARTQADLAASVGVTGPTMSHHLEALERSGLVTRQRDPANRRVQQVSLTAGGDALFSRLRAAAGGFDRRVRMGLSAGEEAELRRLLDVLHGNVTGPAPRSG